MPLDCYALPLNALPRESPRNTRSGNAWLLSLADAKSAKTRQGPTGCNCISGRIWYTSCGTSNIVTNSLRRNGVQENVMFVWLRRTELPNAEVGMTICFTFPLTAIPKRYRLTTGAINTDFIAHKPSSVNSPRSQTSRSTRNACEIPRPVQLLACGSGGLHALATMRSSRRRGRVKPSPTSTWLIQLPTGCGPPAGVLRKGCRSQPGGK
jgi:hypothetical protein